MTNISEVEQLANIQSSNYTQFPHVRLRRLRQHEPLRDLVREHHLQVTDLIMPLFIKADAEIKSPITSMPGQFQWSLSDLDEVIHRIMSCNLPGVILFGITSDKDATGSSALLTTGIIQTAVRKIKQITPQLLVITDLCCCEYTDHGHCGVLASQGVVDNDATLSLLAAQAVSHAVAGADIIAPSGMMDGAVQHIRQALDQAGFTQVLILSYAVKFASAFYGPFREAAESAPVFGDRRAYQLDPANVLQGLREAQLDINEGADMLMVKPAQNYLDVIYRVKQAHPGVPLAAYQVSGEYAMIKAAAAKGWVQEHATMLESLLAIKRAGADFILTYWALDCARYLNSV